jgi:hypothetical protein
MKTEDKAGGGGTKEQGKEEPSSLFQRQRVDMLLVELSKKFPIPSAPPPPPSVKTIPECNLTYNFLFHTLFFNLKGYTITGNNLDLHLQQFTFHRKTK